MTQRDTVHWALGDFRVSAAGLSCVWSVLLCSLVDSSVNATGLLYPGVLTPEGYVCSSTVSVG